MMLYIDA